jgi:hypothetical protein
MARCPVCGRPVVQPKTGRPRVFCGNAHRQAWFRRTHPLGWRVLRAQGIEDRSPLQMLRQQGLVDDSALRMVDAMFTRIRGR